MIPRTSCRYSKALQSVRSFAKAGHVVVFGDDDDENGDGVNYFLGLYIAPKHEAGFTRPEVQ